jgi:uncharacterized membrane protein
MTGSSARTRRRHRPLHPPFTHFPIAAYVFAAAFDVISALGGRHSWAGQLWHAGTFVLIGGLAICLITMGTGFWDLARYWPQTANAVQVVAGHVVVMAVAFMIGAGDIAWRLSDYGSTASTPPGVVALSVAAAVTACTGAYLGGRLVFGHGIGVAANALAVERRWPGEGAADDHEQASSGRAAPATARRPPPGTDTLM